MSVWFILATVMALTSGKSVEDIITGKYRLEKSTNVENYLKELGFNKVLRSLAAVVKPDVIVKGCTSPGCEWKTTTKVPGIIGATYTVKFKLDTEFVHNILDVMKVKFKLDTEFVDNILDVMKVRTTVQKTNPTTLVETQRGDNGKVVTVITSVFSKDAMKVTLKANQVTAHRVFKRIKE